MQKTVHLVSYPSLPLTPTGNMNASLNYTRLFSATHHRNFQLNVKKSVLCAARKRKRYAIGRSGRLMLESACVIASKLRILPEPFELLLREFGAGNGGGNGFWNGFGRGGFDGWRRRRRTKLGMMITVVVCGVVGLWLVMGKELVLDAEAILGGLGLLLFGLSVEGWRRGAKDWILGFCCCAFLVGLVLKKEDFRTWVRCF
ncbi:hypothetical protein Salat_1661100 [Sesamum alatum]|uniref:Uncharacterized protein n=1 Tax=Sesamum alatum TaxID=300844 RepID=A0AAE1Y6N2_9LAMI|nr:hypothetical protein Salat_1661100 [Sesamum alatum]